MGANFQESSLWFSITYLQSGQERHFWDCGHTVQPSAAGQSILLPSQRYTHPSIPAHSSPKLPKDLGYLGECHIPGKKLSAKFVSSAQDSSWLISLFAAHLSEMPVWRTTGRARKEPEKINSLSEMDPPFHLAGNPKEGITFPYTCQPAWEMRNCSPFIR